MYLTGSPTRRILQSTTEQSNHCCQKAPTSDELEQVPGSNIGECADACSKNPECQVVNYYAGACWLKKSYVTATVAYGGIDAAIPIKARPDPLVTKCPEADGKQYTSDGVTYRISCQALVEPVSGVVDLATLDAKNIGECADLCSKNPKCQGVNFNPLNSKCVLKDQYSAGTVTNTVVQCAIPISARPPPGPDAAAIKAAEAAATKCPEYDGTQYTSSADGTIYTITCGKVVATAADTIENIPGTTIGECAEACSKNPKCQGVNYAHTTKNCSLKGIYYAVAKGINAYADAAVPLARRGEADPAEA